jgi:CheY-like chemotaxis protein
MYKNNKFDLILMDIMMPIMDGFESAKLIREFENENPIIGRIPIVAFTANTMNNDRELCINSGMDDVIEKPFDIHIFRDIISKLPNA